MKAFGKVAILLFLIVLLVIISSIQKLQEPPQLHEGYTNNEEMTPDIEALLSEGEELDELNQKMLNMSTEESSSMLLSNNETN